VNGSIEQSDQVLKSVMKTSKAAISEGARRGSVLWLAAGTRCRGTTGYVLWQAAAALLLAVFGEPDSAAIPQRSIADSADNGGVGLTGPH